MDKLANLETRIQQVKKEEASCIEALRQRVSAKIESQAKEMIDPEKDGSRSPLLPPSSDDETPISSPSPEPRKAEPKLPEFLRDSWLDRHHRLAFLGVEFLLWATLFYIFVLLEFGFVYFTLSILYFIWRNTRTRRKRSEGELSAYSVFNPNCEPIHGTVSPTQLTRELGLAVPIYT